MNGYLFFLARKFLGRRHQESFIWFTSVISIVGIALGVASLMIVLGVMNGFGNDLRRKIVGANPHIVIQGNPYLSDYKEIAAKIKRNFPEVTDIGYFAQTQVIFKSSSYLIGGYLKGLQQNKARAEIGDFLKAGRDDNLNGSILLGSELAKELGVGVGDTVTLVGGLPPQETVYRVAGIIEYGIYNVDDSLGVISLADFQKEFFYGRQLADIGIKVKNIYRSNRIAAGMEKMLPPYCKVTTWIEKNKILFAALALEKKAMLLILTVIVLLASFNIASSLMMTVYRKIREIGVLKTLGLTSAEIRKVFILQGLILGVRGLLIGLACGGVLIFIVKKYKLVSLPAFIYSVSYLPLDISAREIILICACIILMTFLASVFPAWMAGKLEPAEAIRYE